MRLGMFMMPLHPAHREPAQTLQEDREAIILADRLGFYDAFVGEHLTEKSENITNSFIFSRRSSMIRKRSSWGREHPTSRTPIPR